LDYNQLHKIREALNQELVVGRSYFIETIEQMINRRVIPGKPGRPRIEEGEAYYYVY